MTTGIRGASSAPNGPSEMLGDSDWDDEDLLTIAEASDRLADEVRRCRDRARLLQDMLDDSAELTLDRADLRDQVEGERKRADDLAHAAERIRAGQANAPVPR